MQLRFRFNPATLSVLIAVFVVEITLSAASAQETSVSPQVKSVAPPVAATPPKNATRDRKLESSIAAVDSATNPTRITLKHGTITVELTAATELVQEERGLVASDLKAGDTLSLIALKGSRSKFSIRERAAVANLNPLTLKIGNMATLTVLEPDRWEFERYTPIQPKSLTMGQTVSIIMGVQSGGKITTKRVAVVVTKPKPARARTPRRKTPVPATPTLAPADGNVE